jgi:hypothetical protein
MGICFAIGMETGMHITSLLAVVLSIVYSEYLIIQSANLTGSAIFQV